LLRASLVLLCGLPAAHGAMREITLADGTQVPVDVHAPTGSANGALLLWLPSGFNSAAAEAAVARRLAALGVEVWQADVLAARLLPPLESSLDEVPGADIAQLIDAARKGDKQIYLVASARAGVLALRAAQAWRAQPARGTSGLAGIILLHPNLYVGPPEPGREADYHPAVAQTRAPVFILQPEQSPWRWRLERTQEELEKGGAPVFTRLLADVRDRFYFRPDATVVEAETARSLAEMLRDAALLMRTVQPGAVGEKTEVAVATPPARRGGARELRAYAGDPAPPPLRLAGLDGRSHDLATLRGRVVLVNFWASWCPPCVHEMPSLQRLRERLAGRPFTILAVNMAETDKDVRAFVRERVRVDFPILMDRDGAALKRWKVFVFPTSFVIGLDGRIRYALVGDVDWTAPELVGRIEGLLDGN
jgi:thiol-disulfide isomerase/thioredoxin